MEYYSMKLDSIENLEEVLEYILEKNPDTDTEVTFNLVNAWIITDEDLQIPDEYTRSLKHLISKPMPQNRWNIEWHDIREGLNNIKEIREDENGRTK